MYALFYIWHGILLNDLNKISFNKGLFLGFASLTYLFISFLIFKIFHFQFLKNLFEATFQRALIAGVIAGVSLYAATLVLGVSFSYHLSFKNILVDVTWQIIEQCSGAFFIALAHKFVFVHEEESHI
jgi:hypothetical protein